MEIWKDILGYEGLYQVSDLGRIKSLCNGKSKIRSAGISREYLNITLSKCGIKKCFLINRLVWETFNGKTDLQIDHIIEGNKLDNRLCNLQAVTPRDNTVKHRKTLNKSSKYTGVCWDKNNNKWRCQIRINGKVKHLGSYINEIEAANAYQKELKASAPYIRH